MGSGSGGSEARKKKDKKPKKDRYMDKEKVVEASGPAASAGTSSTTAVTYTIDQLKDPAFWRSQPELKEAGGGRWKYAPDDAFEELMVCARKQHKSTLRFPFFRYSVLSVHE